MRNARFGTGVLLSLLVALTASAYVRQDKEPVIEPSRRPAIERLEQHLTSLPGVPKDWVYPGAEPRRVDESGPSESHPNGATILVLATEATPSEVETYYVGVLRSAGITDFKSFSVGARRVLAWEQNVLTVSVEDGETTIVFYIADRSATPAASAK